MTWKSKLVLGILTAIAMLVLSFALLAVIYGMNRKAWVIHPVK